MLYCECFDGKQAAAAAGAAVVVLVILAVLVADLVAEDEEGCWLGSGGKAEAEEEYRA